jgi:hypothetical protein
VVERTEAATTRAIEEASAVAPEVAAR